MATWPGRDYPFLGGKSNGQDSTHFMVAVLNHNQCTKIYNFCMRIGILRKTEIVFDLAGMRWAATTS